MYTSSARWCLQHRDNNKNNKQHNTTMAMSPPSDRDTRGCRPAKVGHRKSRHGCITCKSRRVKCDEVRPVCGNCTRLKMACSWPPTASNHTTPETSAAASYVSHWPKWPATDNLFALDDVDDDAAGITLPESRARRLMEHRLMHNYYLNAAHAFPVAPEQSWRKLWSEHMPAIALSHDNVLYAIMASSATRLLRDAPGDKDLFDARQAYFISSLHAQRHEVANLTVQNAEPVCFGALLISMTSFAMLKERCLDPYQPPMEWLRAGRGAGAVIWQSVQTIISEAREADYPALMTVATAYPYFGKDQSYFDADMRLNFLGLLTQHLPSGDDWDDNETREAYEKTLSYVGSIQKGVNSGEPAYATTRRLQTFALVVPPAFITLLGLQRPRALVIMAHFWATVSQVHGVWWLGESDAISQESTAKREIAAIKKVLPPEWMTAMVWPLDQVGLRDVG